MGHLFDADVWSGGFYELALEYEAGDPNGVVPGLQQLWRLEMLEGCYLERQTDPAEQPRVDFEPSLVERDHLYGLARVPGGVQIACGTIPIREGEGREWLVLYCPVSALERAYPVGGFPFDRTNHDSWRVPLENWFVEIARRIFPAAPFRIGLVGFEVSGDFTRADFLASGVPATRWFGILVPTDEGFIWAPRTELLGDGS